MESIKELEQMLHPPRRSTDDWYMLNILRKISVRITWLLLHTQISANGVTFLFIVFGVFICLVFLHGSKQAFFIGALMLQLWYALDMVDGEVARYKKQMGATGRFFDSMAHYIVHPWFFISIGFGLFYRHGNFLIFLCSILAGYSVHLVEVLLDVYYSVLYRRLKSKLQDPHKEIVFKRLSNGGNEKKEKSILKKAFGLIHYVSRFPVIIYLMLPLSIVNLFVKVELFSFWLVFYAFAATLVWAGRVAVFVRRKKIDIEYTQMDESLNSWGKRQKQAE